MASSESKKLAQQVVGWAVDKRAEDILQLDLHGLSDVTDFFLVMTGASTLQVQAITDGIVDGATAEGRKPLHVEGRQTARWVLIDFVDLVVHVMHPDARQYYALERLWGDANPIRFDDEGIPIATGQGEAG